jgi:phosphoribosylformimino-5-aminoimidazole carboxamide ribotide isomerase
MIAVPAVDLREGACVQLVGGAYEQERVRLDDPVEVARGWQAMGFGRLHVVDLDAATGRGSNAGVVQRLLALPGLEVQVGGGVRSAERVAELLAAGARRVVVGTRALEEPEWLVGLAEAYPGRLVVAADVRGRSVVTRGWQTTLPLDVARVVERLDALPLAGVMITAVHREGQLAGTDLPLMAELARSSRHPVHASGGITTLEDLRALARAGLSAAILGMALYTGALEGRAVAREFST